MLALGPETRLALSTSIVLRSLPAYGAYFAFDITTGDQFRLNRTSFWILETIGCGVTWGDLLAQFLDSFDVTPQRGHEELAAIIDQFCKERIVRRQPDGGEEGN